MKTLKIIKIKSKNIKEVFVIMRIINKSLFFNMVVLLVVVTCGLFLTLVLFDVDEINNKNKNLTFCNSFNICENNNFNNNTNYYKNSSFNNLNSFKSNLNNIGFNSGDNVIDNSSFKNYSFDDCKKDCNFADKCIKNFNINLAEEVNYNSSLEIEKNSNIFNNNDISKNEISLRIDNNEDNIPPNVDFGDQYGVIYIQQNSVFVMDPIFYDNDVVIEDYVLNNDFDLANNPDNNLGYALTYAIYAIPENVVIVNNNIDFNQLQLIDVSQVLTHEIGEQYYLIYIAQDNAKNISSLNILKIEVVGEEINSDDIDINLFNKIKSMVEAETGNKRDCLFSSDLVKLNKRVIDFTNCNISSVKGINLFDFTGIEVLNLACNLLDENSLLKLNPLSRTFSNMKIYLMFNKVLTQDIYEKNIILGVQNLRKFYLNESPDVTYQIYDDYKEFFDYYIYYKSGLDGSTLFSAQLTSDSFPQTGYYLLKFVSKDMSIFITYEIVYGSISLYNQQLTVEAGSNFVAEALKFSAGLSSKDFLVEVVTSDGEIFKTNKTGEYLLTYNVFEKNLNNQFQETKGNFVIALSQTIIVVDTTGPVITPVDNESYCYIGNEYIDSGATAVDFVDGDCQIEIIGSVDTSCVGDYILTYKSYDLKGNVSTLDKVVHVIYPVITKINIEYDNSKTYHVNEDVEFVITFYSNEMQIPGSAFTYSIYVDEQFVKTCNTNSFSLSFKESGRSVITISLQSFDDEGHLYTFSHKQNFEFKDDIWWGENWILGACIVIIVIFIISSGIYAFYVINNYVFKSYCFCGVNVNEKRKKIKNRKK